MRTSMKKLPTYGIASTIFRRMQNTPQNEVRKNVPLHFRRVFAKRSGFESQHMELRRNLGQWTPKRYVHSYLQKRDCHHYTPDVRREEYIEKYSRYEEEGILSTSRACSSSEIVSSENCGKKCLDSMEKLQIEITNQHKTISGLQDNITKLRHDTDHIYLMSTLCLMAVCIF